MNIIHKGSLIIAFCAPMLFGQTQNLRLISTESNSFTKNLVQSTKKATFNPITIATIVSSVAIYSLNADQRITDWATSKHPIFKTEKNAKIFSDALQYTSLAAMGTAYTIDLIQNSELTREFARMAAFDLSAVLCTIAATELTKSNVRRLRPDASDRRSFISGHTSAASVSTTVAAMHVRQMHISKSSKLLLNSGLFMVAAGTAWGRVEGRKHYASDVLAGAAVGHFLGIFLNEIANPGKDNNTELNINLQSDNYAIMLAFDF
jgi:membrane-associated phospholipid phosphatase